MSQSHEQIWEVMDYIEEHLHEDLPLEKLAAHSNYSPYHFHRVFTQFVGETPASYIKRLRLERAAHLLIYEPEISVTEISFQCGFSSISYFTQAFKQAFHVSPKAWREGDYLDKFPLAYLDSKISKEVRRNQQDHIEKGSYNLFKWVDLNRIKPVHLPSFSYVFRQHLGNYTEEVNSTWEDVLRWVNARDYGAEKEVLFGLPRNNPFITPEGKCRYDCCIRVKESVKEQGVATFSGGKFALYEFETPVGYRERNHIIQCYTEMYSVWLPKSGYRFIGNPIELVQIKPIPNTLEINVLITGIAIPIEPK